MSCSECSWCFDVSLLMKRKEEEKTKKKGNSWCYSLLCIDLESHAVGF